MELISPIQVYDSIKEQIYPEYALYRKVLTDMKTEGRVY